MATVVACRVHLGLPGEYNRLSVDLGSAREMAKAIRDRIHEALEIPRGRSRITRLLQALVETLVQDLPALHTDGFADVVAQTIAC